MSNWRLHDGRSGWEPKVCRLACLVLDAVRLCSKKR